MSGIKLELSKLVQLREFVRLCQANPNVLHLLEIGFFKHYIKPSTTITSKPNILVQNVNFISLSSSVLPLSRCFQLELKLLLRLHPTQGVLHVYL